MQKTPLVFDVSVWELFWWLFAGASVCLLEPRGETDPEAIMCAIEKNNVTTIHFVPSMLKIFMSELARSDGYGIFPALRQVFASGEALSSELVYEFGKLLYQNGATRLINLYGPTEATVDVSYYECRPGQEGAVIPIGKPIDNIRLYILDRYMQLAPIHVCGELYIAGAGLARGYLNNNALTEMKFVRSGFGGERLYRTGDLARWLPDGNIEYLGRVDHQVKIRGARIELGEIEYQMATYEGVSQPVVIVRGKEEDKYLVAYYLSEKEVTAAEWRAFLSRKLPDYMIPLSFMPLRSMPLTSNGKLDRKALPDQEIPAEDQHKAPTTETEEMLAEIWMEILKLPKEVISVNKSFFELGGHSLKATALVNKIFKKMKIGIPLLEIFELNTIQKTAEYIDNELWLSKESADKKETQYDEFILE